MEFCCGFLTKNVLFFTCYFPRVSSILPRIFRPDQAQEQFLEILAGWHVGNGLYRVQIFEGIYKRYRKSFFVL